MNQIKQEILERETDVTCFVLAKNTKNGRKRELINKLSCLSCEAPKKKKKKNLASNIQTM